MNSKFTQNSPLMPMHMKLINFFTVNYSFTLEKWRVWGHKQGEHVND
jgi:hypothetical protein